MAYVTKAQLTERAKELGATDEQVSGKTRDELAAMVEALEAASSDDSVEGADVQEPVAVDELPADESAGEEAGEDSGISEEETAGDEGDAVPSPSGDDVVQEEGSGGNVAPEDDAAEPAPADVSPADGGVRDDGGEAQDGVAEAASVPVSETVDVAPVADDLVVSESVQEESQEDQSEYRTQYPTVFALADEICEMAECEIDPSIVAELATDAVRLCGRSRVVRSTVEAGLKVPTSFAGRMRRVTLRRVAQGLLSAAGIERETISRIVSAINYVLERSEPERVWQAVGECQQAMGMAVDAPVTIEADQSAGSPSVDTGGDSDA